MEAGLFPAKSTNVHDQMMLSLSSTRKSVGYMAKETIGAVIRELRNIITPI